MTIPEEIEQLKKQIIRSENEQEEAEHILILLNTYDTINSRDSTPYIDRLFQLSEKLGSVRYQSWVIYHRAVLKRLAGEYDDSMDLAEQAFGLFTSLKEIDGLSNAYSLIAHNYFNQGKGEEALENHLLALQIRKKTGNKAAVAGSYNNIGTVYAQQGSYQEGLKYHLLALEIANDIDNKRVIALSYNNIGRIYYLQGNYTEALKNHLQALGIREAIGDKQGIAHSYTNIGNAHWYQGNYAEARINHLCALKIMEEIGDNLGMSNSYMNIGITYSQQGNYPDALKNLLLALKIREQTGNKLELAYLYINIGSIYEAQGNYPEALKNYLLSLKSSEQTGNKKGISSAYINIGNIYYHQGNYPEALRNNLLSLKIKKDLGDKIGIAHSYHNIAVMQGRLHNYRKALKIHFTAILLRKEIGDKPGVAESYNSIGDIYDILGKYVQALSNHSEALTIAEEIGSKRVAAISYDGIGKVYEKQGNHAKAIQNLLPAFQISEEIGDKDMVKKSSLSLFTSYKAIHDYENALKYYEIYHKAESEMLGEQARKQLTNLNFQHNLEQKEKEAEINRLKYVELEDKNKQIAAEKEEAERQRHRAEQSERFKQMFLANMSHEIRTPMNAIVGMTNLLLTESQSEKNLRYLNAIKHSSDILLVVINDVLDLSKIEAGKLSLETVPFDLYQQLELMREMFELKAKEKKLQLKIGIDPAAPRYLLGDPHRLNQVLINLLGNAVKFTQKGSVSLGIEIAAKNQYRFAINDTGIGISADKLNSVFESFTQAESDTTRQYGGTGLGLTISQKLVELMGGKITVHSKAGKGSEFSFIVSLKQAKTGANVPVKNKTGQLTKQLKGISILLAEDNAYNQVVAVDTLKKFIPKCEVAVAKNGKEVLQKLKAKDFDIILMDLHMPQMDGYEASQHIRKDFSESKKHIPILALTASVIRADIDRCLKSGMNGYVSKPFSPNQLVDEIYKQLGNKSGAKGKTPVPIPKRTRNKTIDTSYLEEFANGNIKNIKKYIGIFLQSAPVQLRKAERAVKKGDAAGLYAALHTIRPQLKFMGLPSTLLRTEQLELKLRRDSKIDNHVKQTVLNMNLSITTALIEWEAYKFKLTQ